MLGNENYAKVVPVEVKGKVYFDIDRAVVSEKQKKTADMKGFEEFIKTNQLTGISISSYASPDGELKRNDQLSVQRTDATYKYFITWLKKNKITQVNDSSFYKKSATAEDWDGLKQVASASDFADRDEIVNIVTTISDIDAREREIKKLKSYRKIADKLLPQLRRSEVTLMATEKRKTDEEIATMSKIDTSKLTVEELMYASTLTVDMNEKLAIYNRVSTQFSSDWRGKNNVAYVYLTEGGKADQALSLLKEANGLDKDNAVVYNNMGVAYAQLKDYKNAEKYYTLAKSLGAQNNVNLGNLKVRTGDYAAAASFYGSANSCSYNAALAATLAGNYDAAMKNAECATQDADAFYLKAIIGARTNNLDMLTTNLTRAIRENASLREVAKKDLEFKKYMDTDLFKVAVR
jgi:tetratricopeptide (TPR) repeat protein